MISSTHASEPIDVLFKQPWILDLLKRTGNVLIKINMARTPEPRHPRTDTQLLAGVIACLSRSGKKIAVTEAADGNLDRNLHAAGMDETLERYRVDCIDIDDQDHSTCTVGSQEILIPRFFERYNLRLAIPCSSKREGMIFSNNVKLFFGATPRVGYTRPGEGVWRSKLHDNLTRSVINVFDAFNKQTPFHLYINGGNAYSENRGALVFDRNYLSDSATELDSLVFRKYFPDDEKPEYLSIMESR